MGEEETAYLTIVSWPKAADRVQAAGWLAEAAGLDPFLAEQRVAKGLPSVVQRLPAERAREAVRALRAKGVGCFAPTQTEIESGPEPILAKRLSAPEGAPEPMYLVEPWRGEPTGFLTRDIFLLVRARIKIVETQQAESGSALGTANRSAGGGLAGMALGLGTAGVIGIGMYASSDVDSGASGAPTTKTSTTDVLDVYLRNDVRVRINGDKFGFDVLGAERGYSDNENMDKLAVRLAEQAPGALVDTGYNKFNCPGALLRNVRLSPKGKRTRNDTSVFEFYSVWAWLMYRRLAKRQ